MSKTFAFTKDELLVFAKRVYEEACGGYLDLCESVADRMTGEFLKGRDAQKQPEKQPDNYHHFISTSGNIIYNGDWHIPATLDLSVTSGTQVTVSSDPALAGNIVSDPPMPILRSNSDSRYGGTARY